MISKPSPSRRLRRPLEPHAFPLFPMAWESVLLRLISIFGVNVCHVATVFPRPSGPSCLIKGLRRRRTVCSWSTGSRRESRFPSFRLRLFLLLIAWLLYVRELRHGAQGEADCHLGAEVALHVHFSKFVRRLDSSVTLQWWIVVCQLTVK